MPGLSIAAWLAIAGLVAGAGETAYSVYENKQAQGNEQAQENALKQQQANQANLQKQEAVIGSQGQAQAQTGGSLTDSGFQSFVDQLAGYPGYNGTASGTQGNTQTAGTTNTSSNPAASVASILSTLQGGSGPPNATISGGNWPQQQTNPQQWFELSSPVTGG